MPLVPAICTQCGAKISVDPAQQAWLCPACSTPFITEQAINNYNTTLNNTYNIDNKTVVTGNKEVHIHNDEINKLFLIEEGELTRYKGKRSKITVPEGVLGIGEDIVNDSLASLDKITLPSTLKYLAAGSLYLCKHVVFNEDCKLEEIEGLPFGYLTNIVENFPLTVKKWRSGFACANSGYPLELVICCRYSEEEFIRAYGKDKMFYDIHNTDLGTVRAKLLLVFDFERLVETDDGYTIALGKNSAAICAYNGNKLVTRLPSYFEGRPITRCTASVIYNLTYRRGTGNALEEFYLPEHLEEIPDMARTTAKKVYIPSCVKRIGAFGLCTRLNGELVFENGYCEVEEIAPNGVCGRSSNPIYAPFLKVNSSEDVAVTTKFIVENITPAEAKARSDKYESERYEITFINETNLWVNILVQIDNSKEKECLPFTLSNINKTVSFKTHPSEKLFVKYGDKECAVPAGTKTCYIQTAIFSAWKLKCKQ